MVQDGGVAGREPGDHRPLCRPPYPLGFGAGQGPGGRRPKGLLRHRVRARPRRRDGLVQLGRPRGAEGAGLRGVVFRDASQGRRGLRPPDHHRRRGPRDRPLDHAPARGGLDRMDRLCPAGDPVLAQARLGRCRRDRPELPVRARLGPAGALPQGRLPDRPAPVLPRLLPRALAAEDKPGDPHDRRRRDGPHPPAVPRHGQG